MSSLRTNRAPPSAAPLLIPNKNKPKTSAERRDPPSDTTSAPHDPPERSTIKSPDSNSIKCKRKNFKLPETKPMFQIRISAKAQDLHHSPSTRRCSTPSLSTNTSNSTKLRLSISQAIRSTAWVLNAMKTMRINSSIAFSKQSNTFASLIYRGNENETAETWSFLCRRMWTCKSSCSRKIARLTLWMIR
jgi:hypothetical protein